MKNINSKFEYLKQNKFSVGINKSDSEGLDSDEQFNFLEGFSGYGSKNFFMRDLFTQRYRISVAFNSGDLDRIESTVRHYDSMIKIYTIDNKKFNERMIKLHKVYDKVIGKRARIDFFRHWYVNLDIVMMHKGFLPGKESTDFGK